MNWVEAVGKSVDEAVAAAMKALDVESRDGVEVEVLQEAKPGFLGLGGKEALVRVTMKPQKRRRRRRSRGDQSDDAGRQSPKGEKGRKDRPGDGSEKKSRKQPREGRNEREGRSMPRNGPEKTRTDNNDTEQSPMERVDIAQQAAVAKEFVEGLIEAFGLEGLVSTRIDEDILYLDISGEQTEALVGQRGVVMQSILELTRTVVQRKTFGAPRMRLDIAGYAERRREALNIYARKLADRVLAEGGEVMLEAMNPADRKVVHDAVAEIEGVRSFSEGEDPYRSVVIAVVTD